MDGPDVTTHHLFSFAGLKFTLVNCLSRFSIDQNISNAQIALTIYRRGFVLSQMSLRWLTNSLKTTTTNPQGSLPITEKQRTPNHLNCGNNGSVEWSRVLPGLNILSFNSVSCPYLSQILHDQSSSCKSKTKHTNHMKDDEFYIMTKSGKILAHKSIVASKSGKLAAAIRFNESQRDDKHEYISVQTDLAHKDAAIILAHIYHGSIVAGLKIGAIHQCHQLLELALLADEYLCPTLLLECQMRLLEYQDRQCLCPNCLADQRQITGGEAESHGIVCEDEHDAPFYGLITAETALDVIAVAQQLEESSATYETKHMKIGGPFVTVKRAAIEVVLINFKAVISSRSFLQHTRYNDDKFSYSDQDPEVTHGTDEDSMMLLSMCLDELRYNPCTPKVEQTHLAGINERHDPKS